jgi:hypothetical protein
LARVKRSIAIAICFAAWAVVALSVSSASVEARKLMEFGNIGWEDEMSRLDYLDSKLREEPESIAYIIVYGARRGDRRGETQARIACIRDYMLNRRGISNDRIVVTKGGYREESTVELWLAARGDRKPEATPTVAPQDVRFRKGKIRDWRCRCNV